MQLQHRLPSFIRSFRSASLGTLRDKYSSSDFWASTGFGIAKAALYVFIHLFPFAGLAVLLFCFLSPVPWRLNPSPAMQLRSYVAPDGYLPDIPCSVSDTSNLLSGLAALLNNTNTSQNTTLPSNTTTKVQTNLQQQLFAKGGGDGDEGFGVLGSIIDGISSAIQSSSGTDNAGNPLDIAPHGDFDASPNATVRLWLGPLGTCSRDLDGRIWCTKASYSRPIYNISSFVQPNAYLYPAIIQAQTLGRTTLAFIILAGISCLLFLVGNAGEKYNFPYLFYNIVILISEFVTLWVWLANGSIEQAPGSTNPRHLNTINTFYECNQTSGEVQLTAGLHYYVLMGNHYGLLWVSWLLLYVFGTVVSLFRL